MAFVDLTESLIFCLVAGNVALSATRLFPIPSTSSLFLRRHPSVVISPTLRLTVEELSVQVEDGVCEDHNKHNRDHRRVRVLKFLETVLGSESTDNFVISMASADTTHFQLSK